jgi:hypothetical protein
MMKKRPIIFNSEMVRVILDGRKTQTRRPINIKKLLHLHAYESRQLFIEEFCPFGEVGDRLWVRETWACVGAEHVKPSDIVQGYSVEYKADDIKTNWRVEWWRPSIHMPRWASRITLEITDVKVEKLWDISYEDMIAEGLSRRGTDELCRLEFFGIWDGIYHKKGYGSDKNPWVWVLAFKRLEKKGELS